MDTRKTILYIHGMGGGGDSRIPGIMRDALRTYDSVRLIIRTYDFNPDIASGQIASWVKEVSPDLVIGESMGAIHALAIGGVPHLLVSPSLNAPVFFGLMRFVCLIPGVTSLFDRVYKPKEGDRQKLHFTWKNLRHWGLYRKKALALSPSRGGKDFFHAFFGTDDHYRRSGVVLIRTWEKYYGKTYTVYKGTHFMEEEYIHSLLIPSALKVLGIGKDQ